MASDVRVVRAPVETFLKRSAGMEKTAEKEKPPRVGLSRDVVSRQVRLRPKRIVYVSCDVATQARDLRAFGESGYRIDQVQALTALRNPFAGHRHRVI